MNKVRQFNSGTLSLRLARVGSVTLALPENEIVSIVSWIEPSPLPFASPSVLGVVSVGGRMFTVLDSARLLDVNHQQRESILALRGPEQLAISIDQAGDLIQVSTEEIHAPTEFASLTNGTINREGATVHLVATDKLFAATLLGRERRRRRFSR